MLKYIFSALLIIAVWATVLLLKLPLWIAVLATVVILAILITIVVYRMVKAKRAAKEIEKALQALARVGLNHRAKALPHELSGGEQQRACIARALVNDPVLLLADEPTGNLDPRVADEIQKLLVRLNRQGTALLMATHDYRVVKQFPARTLALLKGRLVEVDPSTL